MSTLKTTNIAHPSSASNNIVLDNSGNVVLQAGTAAAPALQPTGDTNTGVLFPAADTVAISTGGSERVRCDSSGRVGIGTTAFPASTPIQVKAVGAGAGGYAIVSANDENAGGIILNSSSDNSVRIEADPGNLRASSYVNLSVDGTERARIDSSGRLLVGTSTSVAVGQTTGAQIQTAAGTSSVAFTSVEAGNNGARLFLGKSRSGTYGSYSIVSNNDEIGIIAFAADDGTDLQTQAANIKAEVDGTPNTNSMPGRLVFSTTPSAASSPTERMRINNSGFLKVSNTGSYLSATNNEHQIRSNTDNSVALRIDHSGTSTFQYGLYIGTANDQNNTTNYFFSCYGASTERATIRANGGLANYSANNVNLSDINTKKDISPVANTWNCIKEWEIVNYRYKDQPDDTDLNLGVIAQQVAESCPEVITVFSEAKDAKPAVLDDEGNEVEPAQEAQPEKLGVKEQQMYWMAIKALQEAQVRIEQLETEKAEQQTVLDDLLARITALEAA